MCLQIYYALILIMNTMVVRSYGFIYDDTHHHKKVIIHVPVVTHTIYKVIEKGGHHKHGGEVVHHHHHGGHVAHIHKHEGDAFHKHHHVGHAAHHHKHLATAAHKHLHMGKGEHMHKGHALNDHFHKGLYAHDHKHLGAFSSAHMHSGAGLHSHGHIADGGFHSHDHLTHFGGPAHGHDASPHYGPTDHTNNYLGNNHALWMAYKPSLPLYHKYDHNVNLMQPYTEGWTPQQYAPYVAYSTEGEYSMRPLFHQPNEHQLMGGYGPEYVKEYSNKVNKGQGGTTTYSSQNSKHIVNTEFEEQPKGGKQQQKKVQNLQYGMFSPQLSAQLDDTLSSIHDFDELADSMEDNSLATPGYDSQEMLGEYEEGNMSESEEDGQGAFQSPVKTQIRVPHPQINVPHSQTGVAHSKRKIHEEPMMPALPFQVTEATQYF